MSDIILLKLLIIHPSIEPNQISKNLALEPSLTQKKGDQVITPQGVKMSHQYKVSRWQYTKHLEKDWENELNILVKSLKNSSEFLQQIVSEGGKNIIFFAATNFPHATLEMDLDVMQMMVNMRISFGFEFFTNLK